MRAEGQVQGLAHAPPQALQVGLTAAMTCDPERHPQSRPSSSRSPAGWPSPTGSVGTAAGAVLAKNNGSEAAEIQTRHQGGRPALEGSLTLRPGTARLQQPALGQPRRQELRGAGRLPVRAPHYRGVRCRRSEHRQWAGSTPPRRSGRSCTCRSALLTPSYTVAEERDSRARDAAATPVKGDTDSPSPARANTLSARQSFRNC